MSAGLIKKGVIMITAVASQLQSRLQDGSCLLASGPQSTAAAAINKTALTAGGKTAALVSGPQSTAAAAINKTALTAGSTALKTGAGAGTAAAALSAGTVAATILGALVVGVIAYGANVIVRAYID
jgi:hypothetical protein